MKHLKRIVISLGILLLTGTMLWMGARYYVFHRIEKEITDRLKSLSSSGVDVTYASLTTDSWSRSLRLQGLLATVQAKDSLCPNTLRIADMEIRGIPWLSLLLGKDLFLGEVILKEPHLLLHSNFSLSDVMPPTQHSQRAFVIGEITITAGSFVLMDSMACQPLVNTSVDVSLQQLTSRPTANDSTKWSVATGRASSIVVAFPSKFYSLTVKQVVYERKDETLRLDSLYLVPSVDRLTFARNTKRQSDQLICSLPRLEALGFRVDLFTRPMISAHHVSTQFDLQVFRDKRFPRYTRKATVLPIPFLEHLPFTFQLDSVEVLPSRISYEELPANGRPAGKIFFSNLQAFLQDVSTTSTRDASMQVSSRFMNTGDLRARFVFPHGNKPSTIDGSLAHFSLKELNSMLEAAGHVKIHSGTMNELKFHVDYTDVESTGEVVLNYNNLKVESLREDLQKSTRKFLSLLINIFVKSDKDLTRNRDTRTGKIHHQRNSQKGVFHYWWKSILSGVKENF